MSTRLETAKPAILLVAGGSRHQIRQLAEKGCQITARRKVSDMAVVAEFVKFMAATVETSLKNLKVLSCNVYSIGQPQNIAANMRRSKGACFTLKRRETWRVSNETG